MIVVLPLGKGRERRGKRVFVAGKIHAQNLVNGIAR